MLKHVRHQYVQFIKKFPRLYDISRSLSRVFERDEVYVFLRHFSKQYKNINLLQIGANDGLRNDPIREFIVSNRHWRGVLVEPIPYLMQHLQRNYAYTNSNGRLCFENVAISPHQEFLYLWKIKDIEISHFPDYALGMVSFDKNHFFENIPIEVKEEWLEKILVPCKSIEKIVQEMNNQVDLVVIDVEGMEEVILFNFPFDLCSPLCIIFESKHCDENEYRNIKSFLGDQGYVCMKATKDTIVLRKDLKYNELLNVNQGFLKANSVNA